jgi:hypothetical protein
MSTKEGPSIQGRGDFVRVFIKASPLALTVLFDVALHGKSWMMRCNSSHIQRIHSMTLEKMHISESTLLDEVQESSYISSGSTRRPLEKCTSLKALKECNNAHR